MTKSISIYYFLPTDHHPGVGNVINEGASKELAKKISDARFNVLAEFGQDVDLILQYWITGLSGGAYHVNRIGKNDVMGVEFVERKKGRLEVVIRKYLDLAGVPNFVKSSLDYSLIERISREHGMYLKRRVPSLSELLFGVGYFIDELDIHPNLRGLVGKYVIKDKATS